MNSPNQDSTTQYDLGYVKGYRNGFVDGIVAAEERKMQVEKDRKLIGGTSLEV